MSELLVRVADKTSPDVYRNATLTKRGDVIDVRPDGWPWSQRERMEPFWRILSVPVPLDAAEALLAPEFPADPQDFRQTLQRRARHLNLDFAGLPPQMRAALDDDSRATPIITITPAAFRAVQVTKPRIPDPRL